jgi:hypothetical protein
MSKFLMRLSALGLFAGVLTSANASITWHFVNLVSGDPPEGSDWAVLTISDIGTDLVELTLKHNDTSVSPQFIGELWLNLTEIPDDLSADFGSPISSISWGDDAFTNTGNQWDVDVQLFTSQGNRLEVGDSVTWTMSGTGLDEQDFNTLSTPNGENVAALGMIHLQAINGEGSAKLTVDEFFPSVPEPASMAVLGIGAIALLRKRRRQSR